MSPRLREDLACLAGQVGRRVREVVAVVERVVRLVGPGVVMRLLLLHMVMMAGRRRRRLGGHVAGVRRRRLVHGQGCAARLLA